MRIAFYINEIGGGGAERVVTNLANSFSLSYDTVVITSYPTEYDYRLEDRVKRINLQNTKIEGNTVKRNIVLISQLHKLLKKIKPHVVISFMGEPNIRTILACIGINTKTIISVRNDPVHEYAGIMKRIAKKLIIPHADGCVFQTKEAQSMFPDRFQKKSRIIFNAVDPVFFATNYSGERKNVVTCGRLERQKNHRCLIEAFKQIVPEIDDTDRLFIYGEGKLKSELNSLIEEQGLSGRVFLMGQTDNVAEAIKDAKCFVLSSDYEGMPNALLEAVTMGIPSVSTKCPCGGPEMIIEDGVDGLLVPCDNATELAIALKKILCDQEFSKVLGNNAKRRSQKYRPEIVLKQWEDYIKEIVYN